MKKIIKDTIGVTVGSVGIGAANTIKPYGDAIGSVMAAGLVKEVAPKSKKKGGFF